MRRPEPAAALATLSTAELAARARDGCAPSYEQIVHRHEARLANFLRRFSIPGCEAEDLAQDTFLRAWNSIHQYDSRWAFSTWLFTIARRLAAQRHRESKRRINPGRQLGPGEADEPSPALHNLASREQCASLLAAVDAILPEAQRLMIHLRYAEDMEIAEIARALGRTRVSVRVGLHRARTALVDHLAQQDAMEESAPPRPRSFAAPERPSPMDNMEPMIQRVSP